MRPVIGLNTTLNKMDDDLKAQALCHLRYIDAVVHAGGVPLLLPPVNDPAMLDAMLAKLDGFCLIGGPDYDPAHYGEPPHPAAQIMHTRRGQFDLRLADVLLNRSRMPVLGICGGHQLVNLAWGGALIQDLRTQWQPDARHSCTLEHSDSEREGTAQAGNVYRHEVKLLAGSRIAGILGAQKILTNSFHHQAVRPERIGRGLVATGWTPDGVIEAIEPADGSRFLLGVQWHPERQYDTDPQQAVLFTAFIDAARAAH